MLWIYYWKTNRLHISRDAQKRTSVSYILWIQGQRFLKQRISTKTQQIVWHACWGQFWIHRVRAPISTLANSELAMVFIQKFLATHNTKLRHKETWIVESEHHTVKSVLKRNQNNTSFNLNTQAGCSSTIKLNTLLERFLRIATLELTVPGKRLQTGCAWSLVVTYIHSILIITQTIQSLASEMNKMFQLWDFSIFRPRTLLQGTKVHYFLQNSKQNEAIEWKRTQYISTAHYLIKLETQRAKCEDLTCSIRRFML